MRANTGVSVNVASLCNKGEECNMLYRWYTNTNHVNLKCVNYYNVVI